MYQFDSQVNSQGLIGKMFGSGVIASLCSQFIKDGNPQTFVVVLLGLENILHILWGYHEEMRNYFLINLVLQQLEDCGGLERIEQISSIHQQELEIRGKSLAIMDFLYFFSNVRRIIQIVSFNFNIKLTIVSNLI